MPVTLRSSAHCCLPERARLKYGLFCTNSVSTAIPCHSAVSADLNAWSTLCALCVHSTWPTTRLSYIYRQVSQWAPHQTTDPFAVYDLVLHLSPAHNYAYKQCLPRRISKGGKHVFAAGKLFYTSWFARANNLPHRGRKMVRYSSQYTSTLVLIVICRSVVTVEGPPADNVFVPRLVTANIPIPDRRRRRYWSKTLPTLKLVSKS